MKRVVETWYVAADGTRFSSEGEALAHEAKCVEIEKILEPLGVRVEDAGFSRGEGYIPRGAVTVLAVRSRLAELTLRCHPWIRPHGYGDRLYAVSPGWWMRMIDNTDELLLRAWGRLDCIDVVGNEWGQPYFAHNPGTGKPQVWKAGG